MPKRQLSVFDEAFLTVTEDVGCVLLIRHGQQEFDCLSASRSDPTEKYNSPSNGKA